MRVEIAFTTPLQVMEVPAPAPALGHIEIKLTFEQFSIIFEGTHAMYTLPVDHTVLMQVAYVDAKGNPATIDGEVSWQSSDDSIISVQVDPEDSTVCRAMPTGSIGQAQVTAICDADIGDGSRELITLCDIEVVGGEAVSGSIQPMGEPQPISDDQIDNSLPGGQGGSPDNSLPGAQPGIDNSLPGGQPRPDQGLPGGGGAQPKRG
jgi:hypothetical protein